MKRRDLKIFSWTDLAFYWKSFEFELQGNIETQVHPRECLRKNLKYYTLLSYQVCYISLYQHVALQTV